MAVAPISQPLAPGISAVDYSPWSQAAQARSATPGILNYVPNANPLAAPTASPTFQGGTPYGNYVRNYPDLMAAFQNPNQAGSQNIQEWVRHIGLVVVSRKAGYYLLFQPTILYL